MTTKFWSFLDIIHITKCDKTILIQSETACSYKMRQILQSVTDFYYKVCQVLQSVTVTTK